MTHAARLVYLAGSGRSGSTLVERTLGAVPRWVNVGELIELFRKPSVASELCGCGASFAECEFWSAVGQLAFGGWSAEVSTRIAGLQRTLSRQRYLPRLLVTRDTSDSSFASSLREYGAVYDRLYDAIAEVAAADVIVDASKWPGQALALRRSLDRPTSLLHVVRDPRGVAYSWAKTDVSRPQAAGSASSLATHSVTATARRWLAFQAEIEMIRPVFESSARLRYEDFAADPAGELDRAFTCLGYPLSAAQLVHVRGATVELGPSHGIAGNPSRFTHGLVAVRPDAEWTSGLPEADRRRVGTITAPLLVRYGFPLRGAPGTETVSDPTAAAELTELDWPDVDVVVPTRGRPELVTEAVKSVVDQDYPGRVTIFVVHDTEEPLAELQTLARSDRGVVLATNTRTPGLAGARNTGLELCTADLIASCDDDDAWDSDKLRRQVTRMLAEPDLMVLGAGIRLLMSPDHVVEWPGDAPIVTREQLLRSRRKELHSSTLLIRRHVFDAIGGYDEKLPESYAEDYEFLLRAVEVGRIGVVNAPLASIRKYNASWFRDRAEVVAEALEYLLAKHPQIAESKAGHARVLGQIAFAHSTLGDKRAAYSTAGRALRRWPFAPHAALALTHAATGIDLRLLLGSVRKAGRGIT